MKKYGLLVRYRDSSYFYAMSGNKIFTSCLKRYVEEMKKKVSWQGGHVMVVNVTSIRRCWAESKDE